MANPFFIQPTSYGNQLSQLGGNLANLGQQRREQQMQDEALAAQQAQQQAEKEAMSQLQKIVATGDKGAVADFMIANPNLQANVQKNILGAMGVKDDIQREQLKRNTFEILANPEMTPQILQKRIAEIEARGGDATQSRKELEFYAQNPEEFLSGLETLAVTSFTPEFKEWNALRTPEVTQQKPHTNIKVTESGQTIGYNPETRQYETIPTPAAVRSGQPQVSVNITEQPEFEKEIQKLNAKAYSDIAKQGKQVRAEENKLNRLIQLNEKAFEGAGAGAKMAIGQLAKNFGIDVEGLTESEAFRAVSNELVLDKSQLMSGALSEGDMAFLRDTVPNLGNTREGRKEVFDYSKDLISRQKEYIKQASKFKKDNGYFDQAEFDMQFQEYADNNPLFSQDSTQQEQPAKSQYTEGMTATNPSTGEKLVFRGGTWQKM